MRTLPLVSIVALLALGGIARLPAQTAFEQAAQNGARPAPASENVLPPDQQAYQAAWQKPDARDQISALDKVAADYPKSRYASRARMGALRLLVKLFPSDRREISHQVDVMLKGEKPSDPGPYDDVATVLVDAGVLLDKAQSLSERTVKAFTEPGFVADLKREYAEAHLPPQSEARLQHEYRTTRAALLGTLGRIYLEQGKIDRARAIFNQAEQNDPSSTAAAGLGAIAFKEGRLDAAYDNLLRARLTGALSPGDERTFESLFAKRYGDTSRLTTELDAAYRKLFPNPVHVEPYRPAGEPTGHTALLEVFTGAGCDPCAGADVAVDAIRERYSPQDLVVLMYHLHVPLPDPMTNADAVARAAFYKVPGTPTFVVDGSNQQTGGAAREDAERPYGRLTTLIEEALKEVPPAKLSATAARIGNIVKVHATVSDLKDPTGDLTLRVVLAERELRYGGENGIRFHPMVVRAVADFPFAGPGAPGADAGADAEFDIGRLQASLRRYLDEYEQHNDRFGPVTFAEKMDGVDGRNLAVAALIQTSTDRRVLQSVLVDIAGDRMSR